MEKHQVGSGSYKYEVPVNFSSLGKLKMWGNLPKGHSFTTVPALAVDSQDRIYVFNRNPNHVYVLETDGTFLKMWGEDVYRDYSLHSPHGFSIGHDNMAYLVDGRENTVKKFTLDGELLLTIGTGKPGKPGEPFRSPTEASISSSGDIFVADGYGNSRVHKFSPEGELLLSWGKPGTGPGEFNLVHGVWVDKKDQVWVADRANDRIQIFDTEGKFIRQLTGFTLPSTVFIDDDDIVYVPECGGRFSIVTQEGEVLARWGGEKQDILDYINNVPGDFISTKDFVWRCLRGPGKLVGHGICVDSKGDLYIGEAATGQRLMKYNLVK